MESVLKNEKFRKISETTAITFIILILSGMLLNPLQSGAWEEIKGLQEEFNFNKVENSLGQGLIIGICGGFRNIVADIAWLKVDQYWRKRESAATEAWINTTVTIDPRPKFFWTNASRILALDMAAWEIKEDGGWNKVPLIAQDKIIQAHAWKGLKILDEALKYHPNDHDLIVDKANLYYRRLHNVEKAAELYLEASQVEGAPYYLKEIYPQLLIEMNRTREAYEYLKSVFDSVPERFKPEINAWILGLEDELKGIP